MARASEFVWAQWSERCGRGATLRANTLSMAYDHAAQISADDFLFEGNDVTCREPGSLYAVNVNCMPSWLQAKFGIANITMRNNTMRNCGANTSAVFDASPRGCTPRVDGLVVTGNRILRRGGV